MSLALQIAKTIEVEKNLAGIRFFAFGGYFARLLGPQKSVRHGRMASILKPLLNSLIMHPRSLLWDNYDCCHLCCRWLRPLKRREAWQASTSLPSGTTLPGCLAPSLLQRFWPSAVRSLRMKAQSFFLNPTRLAHLSLPFEVFRGWPIFPCLKN